MAGAGLGGGLALRLLAAAGLPGAAAGLREGLVQDAVTGERPQVVATAAEGPVPIGKRGDLRALLERALKPASRSLQQRGGEQAAPSAPLRAQARLAPTPTTRPTWRRSSTSGAPAGWACP